MGDQDRERQAVTLLGVGMESTTGAMVMVLRETGEAGRALPIKIGPHEAHRIGLARGEGDSPPRPLTHQLLLDVIAALGRGLREVTVSELRDGVFLTEPVLDDEDTRISARPSDAVPAALTAGAPLSVAADVLEEAAGPVEQLTDAAFTDPTHDHRPDDSRFPAAEPDEIDHQTEQLRAWLESATADDFTSDPDEPGGPQS